MDAIGTNEWKQLASPQQGPCASLYLPTFPGSPDEFQDHVRLKNLVSKAEGEFCDRGMAPEESRRLARLALQLVDNHDFWHDRSQGLAIFLGYGVFSAWRLPIRFKECLHVGKRFHVARLLPLLVNDVGYATLAFSRDRVRLFHGSRFTFEPIVHRDLPTNIKETMRYEPVTGTRQVHSGASAQMGKAASVHHGQGGKADAERNETKAFFREIDSAVTQLLHREHPPLILASTQPNLRLYREISRYPDVLDDGVVGNADYLSPHELHTQSWLSAERVLINRRHKAIESYGEAAGTGKGSCEIRNVLLAAAQGRVKTLLIDSSRCQWGKFNQENQTIALHAEMRPDDDNLLDWVATETYLKQGEVLDVDASVLPGNSAVAAEFRY